MKLYLRILGYLRPHLGLFSVSIVAMICFAALDVFSFTLLIPLLDVLFQGAGVGGGGVESDGLVSGLLDRTVGGLIAGADPMVALRNVVLVMFLAYLAKNVAAYVQQYTVSVVEGRVTRDLRNDIYDHLLDLDLPFFQRTRAGQIISRATVDVDQIRTLVTRNLAKALSSSVQVLFFLVVLFSLSWQLTLLALLSLPPMLGMWTRFRRRLRAGFHRVLDTVGELSSQLQETVGGIRLVKSSGAEELESERFQGLTGRHFKAFVRDERWRQLFPPAAEMIAAAAVLALLWFGSYLVLETGALGASAFLALLALAMKLMSPAKWLGHFPALVQPGLVAAARVFELIDEPRLIGERPGALRAAGLEESIRLERVSFSYAGDGRVLRDVNVEIPRGSVVALVGPSGAGKSTLADLLPRFHDPTSGRVTLDGTDLRDLKLKPLRSLFGIVSQETVIFHDTVCANLAYGVRSATRRQVEEAARAAHAHDFISALPEGYATVLGERGTRLSGGQRQRLAIARALLRNPPVLILDEATSALDAESELMVQDAVRELMEGRTVLVIAHRLSTVRRADLIVVMDEGRVVQRGRHEELLAWGGLYRRLYEMQFADEPAAV
ncbi:MAG: ABC transporter ATP-binding protein [Longimicrobiaceae bacterium]